MIAVAGVGLLVKLLVGAALLAFSLFYFVFWICMLIDAIQNKGLGDGEKICWVLAIIFLHFLGPFLYFFIGRPKRHAAAVT